MKPPAIWYYAPLKSPRHDTPSGDRTMARLLLSALRAAGYAPALASDLRTFEPRGDPARQAILRDASREEVRRLLDGLGTVPASERPRLWFTYHCYYKAPDWMGPLAAAALGVPYVVAEGSRAAKRAAGDWALAHQGAEAALDRAACVFAITSVDREALKRDGPPSQHVIDLPPFVAPAEWRTSARPGDRGRGDAVRLLAVAMMRPGPKLASYARLADALAYLPDRGWRLDIVGDGVGRQATEALFAPYRDRVVFHGRVEDTARLARFYAEADLLAWPAVDEAYGMALLEAQAASLPVLAGRHGGVGDVVRDGSTGILVAPHDPDAFGRALATIVAEPGRLRPMRAAAAAFVRRERTVDGAAAILRAMLDPLLAR